MTHRSFLLAHRKTVMELRLLGNRVMLDMADNDENKGSIIIPERYRGKRLKGKVVAVGTGRKMKDGSRFPIGINVGEEVLIEFKVGEKLNWNDREYTLVNVNDVIGIYDGQQTESV